MKKLFLLATPLALLFASCGDSSGNLEETFGAPCLNLISDASGQIAPAISPATYSVHINYTDQVINIMLPSLNVGDAKLSFNTPDLKYKSANYAYTVSAPTVSASNNGGEITNLNCRLTSIVNTPPENVVGDVAFINNPAVIMNYRWGNYTVSTFRSDAIYAGQTLTTAPGSDDYTTKAPTYRFKIDPDKLTATLIIYNGKFSDNPKMPALNLVLDGLTATPLNDGYTITGENVIPKTLGEGTPYPAFTFSSVKMQTLAADLTTMKLTFSIASPFGELTGDFTGSYLIDVTNLQ